MVDGADGFVRSKKDERLDDYRLDVLIRVLGQWGFGKWVGIPGFALSFLYTYCIYYKRHSFQLAVLLKQRHIEQ